MVIPHSMVILLEAFYAKLLEQFSFVFLVLIDYRKVVVMCLIWYFLPFKEIFNKVMVCPDTKV